MIKDPLGIRAMSRELAKVLAKGDAAQEALLVQAVERFGLACAQAGAVHVQNAHSGPGWKSELDRLVEKHQP
jgi:hypothetical protein